MISFNKLKQTKLFITVNLRSYLTKDQIEKLFESVLLKKINLICIEILKQNIKRITHVL